MWKHTAKDEVRKELVQFFLIGILKSGSEEMRRASSAARTIKARRFSSSTSRSCSDNIRTAIDMCEDSRRVFASGILVASSPTANPQ
jgi:hypothetical protein